MEVLALIIDFPWTPEDARMYESVSLRSILEHTHGFSSLKQTIEKLPSTVSYKELQKKLNTLSIVAPS